MLIFLMLLVLSPVPYCGQYPDIICGDTKEA